MSSCVFGLLRNVGASVIYLLKLTYFYFQVVGLISKIY